MSRSGVPSSLRTITTSGITAHDGLLPPETSTDSDAHSSRRRQPAGTFWLPPAAPRSAHQVLGSLRATNSPLTALKRAFTITTLATALAGLAFVLALALQRRFGAGHPFSPVGDEIEYLKRAEERDPYSPELFLRVPLLIFLCRLMRGRPRPITSTLGLVSAATVAGVAIIGFAHTGLVIVVPLLLWLALPERVALANRIWPEPILTACASAATGLLLLQPSHVAIWLGGVCALATLTRIDGLVWSPLAAIALGSMQAMTPTAWLQVLLPTGAVLAGLCLLNGLRYGIPLPDTTVLFNLLVMSKEQPSDSTVAPVQATLPDWNADSSSQHRLRVTVMSLASSLKSPVKTLLGVFRRASDLLGRETFFADIILQPSAYQATPRWRRWLLRHGASVLLGSAIAIVLWQLPHSVWFALPGAGIALVSCLAHTRTRYRQPLLPIAVIIHANGWHRVSTVSDFGPLLLVSVVGSGILVFGSSIVHRRRLRSDPEPS